MKEIVVDTNVLISALISSRGAPRSILLKVIQGEVGLVISPYLLLELVSAFSKPKLRPLIPERKITHLVSLIHQLARVVKPAINVHACRDPKDNRVLECAIAGRVKTIVSGDQELLILNPFRRIRIVAPGEFVSLTKSR